MEEKRELLGVAGLDCFYGARQALYDISFRLAPGETLALIGPNGSGKTTLLRAAAGMLPATGSVTLDGVGEIGGKRPEERARYMGYLSSSPVFPPDMTAAELTEKGFHPELGLLGGVTEEQKRRARACLAEFGIGDLADRPLRKLSGGQRQLALLARAAVRRPRVLLLDEPDAALDPAVSRQVMKRLRAAAAETGCGVLLTSHNINLMLRCADRLLMLSAGRIVCDAAPGTADKETLEKSLSALYGPAELIRHGNGWLLASAEDA